MTTYEECPVCYAREAFGDGPCDKCRHKDKYLSPDIEQREVNGVKYYTVKQASTKKQEQEKPYWISLLESY